MIRQLQQLLNSVVRIVTDWPPSMQLLMLLLMLLMLLLMRLLMRLFARLFDLGDVDVVGDNTIGCF